MTNTIRYVGKANNIRKRLFCHLTANNLRKSSHKNNWVKGLLTNGLKPIIEIVDEVPIAEWQFWEKFWISQFKSWGFSLTNLTDGGDTVTPVIKFGDKNPNYNKTINDGDILKLINNGLSQKEIALKLNTNIALISNRMKKFNINFRKNRGKRISSGDTHNFRSDITEKIILGLIKKGFSINKIAKTLKADNSTIKNRLK